MVSSHIFTSVDGGAPQSAAQLQLSSLVSQLSLPQHSGSNMLLQKPVSKSQYSSVQTLPSSGHWSWVVQGVWQGKGDQEVP
jgi:hypothetical protein